MCTASKPGSMASLPAAYRAGLPGALPEQPWRAMHRLPAADAAPGQPGRPAHRADPLSAARAPGDGRRAHPVDAGHPGQRWTPVARCRIRRQRRR
ncbi:hypothetical protein G6F63_016460 [Rhizopus arrhizus]|nr:hypothetical protein G6F63_016460 [Rhizopus arrhizus]